MITPNRTSSPLEPKIEEIILRAARTGRISNRDLEGLISYIRRILHE